MTGESPPAAATPTWADLTAVVGAKVEDAALLRSRRLTLVEAAIAAFLKKGYHETSIQDIATSAGWTKGQLYLYVQSKEDILFLIGGHINLLLAEAVGNSSERSMAPPDRLRHMAYAYLTTVEKHRGEVNFMYRESASMSHQPERLGMLKEIELSVVRQLEEEIVRGIDQRVFRECEAFLVAYEIIAMAHMWATKGWALFPRYSLDEYFNQSWVNFGRILGIPEG